MSPSAKSSNSFALIDDIFKAFRAYCLIEPLTCNLIDIAENNQISSEFVVKVKDVSNKTNLAAEDLAAEN